MARRAVVLVVKQRDFPRALFVAGGHFRREAVQRQDQARLGPRDQFGQRGMIRTVEPVQPGFDIGADIAGDQRPVALARHRCGIVLAPMQVAHEAADRGDMRGHAVAPGQPVGNALDADIDRDMRVEQGRVDAQLDVFGDVVGGVVGDAQQPSRTQVVDRDLAVGEVVDHHRRSPFICHQPVWSLPICEAAASRAATLS